jgi:hypothetical protein
MAFSSGAAPYKELGASMTGYSLLKVAVRLHLSVSRGTGKDEFNMYITTKDYVDSR